MSKNLLNTDAVDGLRALAVMHIVLGHHSIRTGYLGDAREGEDGVQERYSRGLDLVGGASMALFYIISGFVMMLGYGSYGRAAKGKLCGGCDRGCLCCCGDGEEAAGTTGCCYPCFCKPAVKSREVGEGGGEGEPPAKPLDVRAFYWKRFARLAPLWYLGNLMHMLPVYFGNYHWQPTWFYWLSFGLAIPPLGLNAWTTVCFPPAGHLWTISTMTFFYLVFPLLHHRIRRVKPRSLRSLAIALYVSQLFILPLLSWGGGYPRSWVGYWWGRMWPIFRLPCFVMGMCAARQRELEAAAPAATPLSQAACVPGGACLGPWRAGALLGAWLCVIAIGVAEQLVFGTPKPETLYLGAWTRVWGEALLPLLFYDLITALTYPAAAAGPPSRVHAVMASRPLRNFAQISLAVYVVHETLILTLTLAVYGPLEPGELGREVGSGEVGPSMNMPVWGAAATLPLSLALGWLLTHYYERPMSRWILRRAIGSSITQPASSQPVCLSPGSNKL